MRAVCAVECLSLFEQLSQATGLELSFFFPSLELSLSLSLYSLHPCFLNEQLPALMWVPWD